MLKTKSFRVIIEVIDVACDHDHPDKTAKYDDIELWDDSLSAPEVLEEIDKGLTKHYKDL